ncbi:MAG: flagellar hook-basal body complex protein FliE [Thermoplasmatales archaeon]|nr:flagellar hook-basal body complex protein FliE [Thermoplasmatales archaeon]MCW6169950.1 flagellar hook-basal body complex protein FliE [Thermoplasmatales archaeon]
MLIVTGMPGAGKDEFVKVAKEFGFVDVHMGDTVKKHAALNNIPLIDSEIGKFATSERKAKGMDIWARRTAESIKDPDKTVVDGLRNDEELAFFRDKFDNVKVVAIYTNRQERFMRIIKRARQDDVRTEPEFYERDNRELGWGIGRTISLSDYMIVNDRSLEEFKEDVREFFRTITSASK